MVKPEPSSISTLGLLDDPALLDTFFSGIEKNRFTAEYAVSSAPCAEIFQAVSKAKDAYFRDRVKDIYDIERRLLAKLMGQDKVRLGDITEPVAIVAHDLTPSQTASLDRTKIRGIAIDAGGRTSHTAIIANSMGIPAIVGLENITHEVTSGDTLIVNGQAGIVIINPAMKPPSPSIAAPKNATCALNPRCSVCATCPPKPRTVPKSR